jgi:hypothetical protein
MTALEGAVKKRVTEIEGVAKSVECMQPPSFYRQPLSWKYGQFQVTPLLLLALSSIRCHKYNDYVLESPNPNHVTDEALTTMKAEPRMVRLLEKAGTTLDPNNRMPPPLAVCEQW